MRSGEQWGEGGAGLQGPIGTIGSPLSKSERKTDLEKYREGK